MGGAPTHLQQLTPHNRQTSASYRRRRRRSYLDHFPEGSLVEVQTNEDDFKGVYFSATVILLSSPVSPKKISKKNSKKLYVEYHNLLDDEDESKRLREYVDVSFVRPAPPFVEIVTGFEQDDVVDAFYKDGWWTGIVKQVLEGGERFVVTFQNPPDELEFGLAELRAHWGWVDGSWFRPEKQSKAGLMFDVGRKVEVSFDRDDCQDAWFPATIHEDLGNGTLLVEHCADIEKKVQTIKVKTDSLHVRPCPPLLKDKNFVLLEKVDAFFDFGWWSGVITKVLENSRYIVFFKQMKTDKEFNQNELRPHMDWKDGRWFTSSQLSQDVSIPSSDEGMHEYPITESSRGSALAVRLNGLGDKNGTSNDNDKTSPFNALSRPLKKHKEENVLGANQQGKRDRSIKEMVRGSQTPVSEKDMTSSATQTAKGNQSSDNPSWGKRIQRKQRKVGLVSNVKEKVNSTLSSKKKGSTQTLQSETSGPNAEGMEPDAVGNSGEDVQSKYAKKETELPIIIGLPCGETGSSRSGISRTKRIRHSNGKEIVKLVSDEKKQLNDSRVQDNGKEILKLVSDEKQQLNDSTVQDNGKEIVKLVSDEKQQLNDSTVQDMKDSKQLQIEESSEKKRRGRPRKTLIESVQTPVTGKIFALGNTQTGAAGSANLSEKDDRHGTPEMEVMGMAASLSIQKEMAINKDKPISTHSDVKNRRGRMTKRTLTKLQDEKVAKDSIGLEENRSSKRGRRRITNDNIVLLQTSDSLDASGGKTMDLNCTMEVEKVVTDASCNEFENEPLSKWIEGMHSPPVIDGSKPSPVSTVEQCIENSEKQAENEIHVSALVPCEEQSLPFVKSTVLWKTIESMEVFQRIPQRPHFQPLEQFKESSREGLAIGYMVSFSSVVEKASKLQLNDPQSITDECDDILETLSELERQGFDVKVVQDRVTKLLEMKDKQGKLVDEVKELNDQILEHSRKKSKIDEEILEMNELKQEMNEQLRKIEEKLSDLESAKENEDTEIAFSRARIERIEECIKNVERELE
ncbi:hypothetical protein BUALT_Bualt02G0245000 [Buddleja alternifolia]|uniref:Agenet domain-containing protein n=1 Tax=Buddleja alternifolia TaxID=168488 RepID=A0AAV6Y326_9LAMI|nr:hypothetical protein BUALT_Bualt02G0245000 [Buddleja alternifolia]